MKTECNSMSWLLAIFCLLVVSSSTENTGACTCPAPKPSRPTHRPVQKFDNGLGRTPPMGWTSFNDKHCNVSEEMIRQTADALVATGLANLGYQYVNIDDCWAEGDRNTEGKLAASKTAFPSGMKAVVDYVHSKGLKIGIYSSAGTRTCSGTMPGSLGYEHVDAETFAEWGIDYLKYDNCYHNNINPKIRYQAMSTALKNVTRPIFYNMCVRGDAHPAVWGPRMANSWRTTADIYDYFDRMIFLGEMNEEWAGYAGPGGWNDPDVLEIGNGGMKLEEYRIQFSVWAISKAPLILSHVDVEKMDNETFAIISNKEVIDINQDSLGYQARRPRIGTWFGLLTGNRVALLLVNGGLGSTIMTTHWEDIGLANNTVVTVRDVWEHSSWTKPIATNQLTVTIEARSCKMYVLSPVNPTPTTFRPVAEEDEIVS